MGAISVRIGIMTKLKSIKSLQTKAEKLWKECCYIRDGKRCMVQFYYPQIKAAHSDVYQVDHCITRQNKVTFLEVANGTVVCSTCNMLKNNKNKSIDRAINEIVIKREGLALYNRMVEQDQSCSAFPSWRNRMWLEEQIKILGEMIEHQKQQRS